MPETRSNVSFGCKKPSTIFFIELNSLPAQRLTPRALAANFALLPTLLKSFWVGNRPATMSDHACDRARSRTTRPHGARPPEFFVPPPRPQSATHRVFSPSRPPEIPANSFAKICANPCTVPHRQPSSSLNFFSSPGAGQSAPMDNFLHFPLVLC